MDTLNILYEDNHLLVLIKPAGILSQADGSHHDDIVNLAKAYLKEKYQKPGNVFCGLVHRLDQPVSGIMVLAKTSKAAGRLSKQFAKDTVTKNYHAIVKGKPPLGLYEDYLLKDKMRNTTYVSKHGKLAQLEVLSIRQNQGLSLVKLNLITGRPHQIRVQMASRGFPLINDHRYNKKATINQDIALFASKLTFDHPTTKQRMIFDAPLPSGYPWDIFK